MNSVQIFYDNKATIHISNNPMYHERTKHIEIDWHLIREKIKQKLSEHVILEQEQAADIFTKSLDGKLQEYLISKVSMIGIFKHTSLRGSMKILNQDDKCNNFRTWVCCLLVS